MHVRAGIAIRYRIDIQGIDLIYVDAEPVGGKRERFKQFAGRECGRGCVGHRHAGPCSGCLHM